RREFGPYLPQRTWSLPAGGLGRPRLGPLVDERRGLLLEAAPATVGAPSGDHCTRSMIGSGCSPRYSTQARLTHGECLFASAASMKLTIFMLKRSWRRSSARCPWLSKALWAWASENMSG